MNHIGRAPPTTTPVLTLLFCDGIILEDYSSTSSILATASVAGLTSPSTSASARRPPGSSISREIEERNRSRRGSSSSDSLVYSTRLCSSSSPLWSLRSRLFGTRSSSSNNRCYDCWKSPLYTSQTGHTASWRLTSTPKHNGNVNNIIRQQ